jgi:serine/threonine protein phosphatase PrpC
MGDEIGLVDASQKPLSLLEGDVLLLSSDGLMTLSETQITSLIHENETAANDEIAKTLIEAVKKEGRKNQDNITVLLYSIELNGDDEK